MSYLSSTRPTRRKWQATPGAKTTSRLLGWTFITPYETRAMKPASIARINRDERWQPPRSSARHFQGSAHHEEIPGQRQSAVLQKLFFHNLRHCQFPLRRSLEGGQTEFSRRIVINATNDGALVSPLTETNRLSDSFFEERHQPTSGQVTLDGRRMDAEPRSPQPVGWFVKSIGRKDQPNPRCGEDRNRHPSMTQQSANGEEKNKNPADPTYFVE